jgi:predicted negative regulator of RcsB-dependent stress response
VSESDEKDSREEDLDKIAKNIDALDSEAAKASEGRLAAEKAAASKPADDKGEAASESAEADSDDEEEGDEDVANPAAIARRVAALGAEDETEALAREEERKLAERRAAKKKGKKKTGLEAAASKKLSKIGTRAEPKRTVAVAADADPLIERTAKLSDWAKKNQKTVQMVGALLTVALLAIAGTLYYQHKKETDASVVLTKAIEVQRAKIGEPKKDDEEDEQHEQYFKTAELRRDAALKQYREVQSKYPGTGAAILARLAEGSLLLDKKEPDAALAAYNDVKGSPLAAADTEVKGRALEGVGFAYELKALATPADKDKNLDAALAAYKELENAADVKGFKELAMYHQGRVLMNKGNKEEAKQVLSSLKERLAKADEPLAAGLPAPPTYPFLKEVAMDRLREVDPEAAPKAPKGHGGAGGGMSEEQIQRMIEQMKKQQQGGK